MAVRAAMNRTFRPNLSFRKEPLRYDDKYVEIIAAEGRAPAQLVGVFDRFAHGGITMC
jgi:hypothetical protein